MSDELKVRFWGVRGGHPSPGTGMVKYGGNTPSVEIRAGERTIILDAGTGIIPLGHELNALNDTDELMLLFSHLHQDHTQGFPFFVPAYLPGTTLHIFGPDGTHESLQDVLERNQSSETFPVSLRDMFAVKNIRSVRESQVIVWDEDGVRVVDSIAGVGEDALVVRIHKSYAHPGGVFVYRITWRGMSVVYATDIEGYVGTDKRLVKFAKDADVLIHDAQYLDDHYWGAGGVPATQGYGHSTVTMACEVAAAAQSRQLILFHHDPAYDDTRLAAIELLAQSWFEAAIAAYEGLEIMLQDKNRIAIPNNRHHRSEVQYAKNG